MIIIINNYKSLFNYFILNFFSLSIFDLIFELKLIIIANYIKYLKISLLNQCIYYITYWMKLLFLINDII